MPASSTFTVSLFSLPIASMKLREKLTSRFFPPVHAHADAPLKSTASSGSGSTFRASSRSSRQTSGGSNSSLRSSMAGSISLSSTSSTSSRGTGFSGSTKLDTPGSHSAKLGSTVSTKLSSRQPLAERTAANTGAGKESRSSSELGGLGGVQPAPRTRLRESRPRA